MNLEIALIEARLQETFERLTEQYGEKEARVAEFILRKAMGQLLENSQTNSLSVRRVTACFLDLVFALDEALDQLEREAKDNSKN